MSNFEYIISSLPFLTYDYTYENGQGFYSVLEEIKENLGEEDTQTLDFLLEGFSAKSLGADFYAKALKFPLRFVGSTSASTSTSATPRCATSTASWAARKTWTL